MKRVVASGLMLNKHGHLLMSKGKKSGLLCPPGGKIEEGELIVEGLIRELKEEIGVTALHPTFFGFQDLKDKVIFFFIITDWTGKIRNLEPHKHDEWEWHSVIPDNRFIVEGLQLHRERVWEQMYNIWAKSA